MDMNGGVKVTYIETQFVTFDAAGFKDLVQRLTGRAAAPAQAPHRPRLCRATAGPQGCSSYRTPWADDRTPPYQQEELDDMADFSDLFYFGASERRRGPHNGGYNDFQF